MKKKNTLLIVLAGLAALLSTTFCIIFPISRPELSFMPDKMPDARVGVAYKVEIVVSGNATPVGDYSIPDGALPPGLELVMDEQYHTARIEGTPTQAGIYTFTVSVWCYGTNVSGQTGEKQYTLVVGE
jgi:hypothetical protein